MIKDVCSGARWLADNPGSNSLKLCDFGLNLSVPQFSDM